MHLAPAEAVGECHLAESSSYEYRLVYFPSYLYFWKLYFARSSAFFSSSRLVKYALQPGQKLMCHRQNLPNAELGFLS